MFQIVFNTAALVAKLAEASKVLGDLTPIHQDVTDYMVEATKKRFVTSTAPDGSKWQPKKPATIARYLARGDGNRPKPLIGPSGRLGREIAGLATKSQAEIGSALEYSAVMQGGAGKGAFGNNRAGRLIPWGDIPARVFLGLSDDDERNILDIVDDHLGDALSD